jgi:hypothetical protein
LNFIRKPGLATHAMSSARGNNKMICKYHLLCQVRGAALRPFLTLHMRLQVPKGIHRLSPERHAGGRRPRWHTRLSPLGLLLTLGHDIHRVHAPDELPVMGITCQEGLGAFLA